ncbi:O-antigen ligase family protein [Candidatus Parcubacteria bacterium]|nr:O-antigen ligase family protein [Candidatus Parcubacteria bacterium]
MQTSQLTKIIKALLYCLALTPLIITPMTIFPFNFGRGLIVQLLIEIIFGLYFVLAIFNKDYRPKRNPLFIALGIFMGVMFLASIFGVDFNKSFWGNEERFTGWFYLVHILLLFIVLSSALKDKKEWRRFLSFNVFVSLVMFGIAILSLWGIKFWGVDLGSRISGTLGNPIFIGSYFILNLLLSGYLFFNYRSLGQETLSQQVPPLEKGRAGGIYKFIIKSALIPLFQRGRREGGIYKLFFGASSLILLVGIFLTQSRGAILGMVFGIFIGAVYFCIFNKNKKIKKIILSALVIFIILGGLVFALREQNFIKENAILNRITSISLAKGTGNTRILGWEVALKGIVDRPFLGWGQENFHIAFNKYYNPELLKYSYYETWFDKPHNIVLEMGINGGIFGVLSYLGIFGAGFFLLHKKKDIFSLPERAVIFGGSVAYFAQNLFAFDTPVSLLLFVVVLGLISGLREGGERENRKIALTPLVATVIIILIFWLDFKYKAAFGECGVKTNNPSI